MSYAKVAGFFFVIALILLDRWNEDPFSKMGTPSTGFPLRLICQLYALDLAIFHDNNYRIIGIQGRG